MGNRNPQHPSDDSIERGDWRIDLRPVSRPSVPVARPPNRPIGFFYRVEGLSTLRLVFLATMFPHRNDNGLRRGRVHEQIADALVLCALSSASLRAQLSPRGHPFVRSSGDASIFVQPDQVMIDASVTTQGPTAQDASAQNASRVAAVLAALGKLLDSNGRYQNHQLLHRTKLQLSFEFGGTPILIGYTATNTVEVTASAVSFRSGDTATRADTVGVGDQVHPKDAEPAPLPQHYAWPHCMRSPTPMRWRAGWAVRSALVSVQESSAVRAPLLAGTSSAPSTQRRPWSRVRLRCRPVYSRRS